MRLISNGLSFALLIVIIPSLCFANENISTDISYNHHTGFYLSANTLPPFVGSLYAGYMMTPSWGVEAGVDAIWGFDLLGTVDAEMYHLDLKGVLPLGSRAELFGKIGLGYIYARSNGEVFGTPDQSSGSFGGAFGLGFGYDFTPAWVMTAEVNAMIYHQSEILKGGVGFIPSIGITHYFSV